MKSFFVTVFVFSAIGVYAQWDNLPSFADIAQAQAAYRAAPTSHSVAVTDTVR